MMRFRAPLLVALTLVTCVDLCAQAGADKVKVKVRMSDDKEADAKLRPYSIIRPTATHIMMMRSGEFDVRAFGTLKTKLDLYDLNKLTYVRSQDVDMKGSDGAKLLTEDLVQFGGRAMLIGRGTGDAVSLYYQELDPTLTKAPKAPKPFCTWEAKVKEKKAMVVSAGDAMRTPYTTRISPDSSHMLVCSPEIRSKEGEAVYLLAMVDRSMDLTWQQMLTVSEKAKLSRVLDVEVDDKGNAYVLLRNDFSGKDFVDGEANFEVKLIKVSAEGASESKFQMEPGTHVMTGLLRTLKDGRIACAGVYGSSDKKTWKTVGNFVATVPAGGGTLGKPVWLPFSGEGMGSEEVEEDDGGASGTKAEQKDKARLGSGTDVIGLLPVTGGGFYLVNELTTVSFTSTQSGGSYPVYYHGPLLIRRFDAEGKELWSKDLRRWTSSASFLIGRVFPAVYNDQLFLFLLDSEEMATRRKAGEKISPKHARDPYSAYAMFDAKGDYKVKAVLRSDKEVDYISGWDLMQVSSDVYMALGTEKLTSGRFLPVRIEFSKEAAK